MPDMTINQLTTTLLSGDLAARAAAIETLASMDAGSLGPAAPALALAAGDPALAEASTALLEEMDQPATDCHGQLAELLTADAADTAYWAATLLGRAGADAGEHADALAELADKGPNVAARERAVWALSKLGPHAARTTPTLTKLADSKQARLARLANQALASIEQDRS